MLKFLSTIPFFVERDYKTARINLLEEIFVITYTSHISYQEAYSMPCTYRKWFYNRILKQKRSENPK